MLIQQISQYISQNPMLFYGLLVINLLLIVFAPVIVKRFSSKDVPENTIDFRVNVIRGLNVLVLSLLGYILFYGDGQSAQGVGIKLLSVLVIIYLSYLAVHLIGRFIRLHFGRPVQHGGSVTRIADTYASRALSIFISVFIAVMALEAGGVIGFIGVFLALTQSAWAPDIISGLVILNSKMFSERDVITLCLKRRLLLLWKMKTFLWNRNTH